jgi:hypothetical protein
VPYYKITTNRGASHSLSYLTAIVKPDWLIVTLHRVPGRNAARNDGVDLQHLDA